MDTHSITVLKKRIDTEYGTSIPRSTLDQLLATCAPEFYEARKRVRAGHPDWLTLKTYSTFCRYDERHEDYERLLQEFDSELKFPASTRSQFFGDGFGDGSLNSYRIVQHGGQKYFEKIYLKESPDFKNSVWFYRDVQPKLSEAGLRTPRLDAIIEGRFLSIVRVELVEDAQPITRAEALRFYQEQFHTMYDVERAQVHGPGRSFTKHTLYLDGKRKAAAYGAASLYESGATLTAMEEATRGATLMFCHGDWYSKNVNREGIVFDWDRCGFYPAGFDLGYCLSKSFRAESLSELDRAIHQSIPVSLRSQCVPAAWFFCLVFYSRRIGVRSSDAFLRALYDEVKTIFGLT